MNITFNENQTRSIQEMAEKLGTKTPQVFKLALSLLKIAIRESKIGNSLASVKDDQIVREIVFK